jgi:hypothetical protein
LLCRYTQSKPTYNTPGFCQYAHRSSITLAVVRICASRLRNCAAYAAQHNFAVDLRPAVAPSELPWAGEQ